MIALAAALVGCVCALHGQIHTLEPGIDLNDASNFDDALLLDWEGDGGVDLIGLDFTAERVVRVAVNPTGQPRFGSKTVIATLSGGSASRILGGEIDGTPGDELVLLENGVAKIWTSGARATNPQAGPDRVDALPQGSKDRAWGAMLADFDGDGADDLLIAGQRYDVSSGAWISAREQVIFGFGGGSPLVVELADTGLTQTNTRIDPPWVAGGGKTISITGFRGNTIETILFGFGPDRAPQEVARYSQESGWQRRVIELNGVAPPEMLILDNTTLRVKERVGDQWVDLLSLPLPDGGIYQSIVVGDMDGDGSQEAVLNPWLWPEPFNLGIQPLILDEPSQGSGWALHPLHADLTQGRALVLPDDSAAWWIVHRPDTPVFDLLGNPISVHGLGRRTTLWTNPLDEENPGELPVFLENPVSAWDIGILNTDNSTDFAMLGDVSTLSFLAGPVDGSSKFQGTSNPQEAPAGEIYLADITGDGLEDVMVAGPSGVTWKRTLALPGGAITQTTGGVIFSSTGTTTAPTRVLGHHDFDGDGDIDLLILEGVGARISWFENRMSSSAWTRHMVSLAGVVMPPLPGLAGVINPVPARWPDHANTRIADVDGDGDPDILSIPSALGNRVTLHRKTSVGYSLEPITPELSIFGEPGLLPSPEVSSERSHLLEGHFTTEGRSFALLLPGRTDMLGNPSPEIRLIGDGQTATGGATVKRPSVIFDHGTAVDFDQDGLTDLVLAGTISSDLAGNPSGSTDLYWLRSLGDGSFTAAISIGRSRGFVTRLASRDLDGDSLPDIIAASEHTRSLEVFLHQTLAPIPPFEAWIAGSGVLETGENDDPDGDGVSNLIEYLQGSKPDGADSQSEAPPVTRYMRYPYGNAFQSVSFTRPRQTNGSMVRIYFESSENLEDWAVIDVEPVIRVDPQFPLWEEVFWDLGSYHPPPTEQKFYRFRAVLPP